MTCNIKARNGKQIKLLKQRTRNSAQGNCIAKSLEAWVMWSILPCSWILHQLFLVLLVFHQSWCLWGVQCWSRGPGGGSGRGEGGWGRGRGNSAECCLKACWRLFIHQRAEFSIVNCFCLIFFVVHCEWFLGLSWSTWPIVVISWGFFLQNSSHVDKEEDIPVAQQTNNTCQCRHMLLHIGAASPGTTFDFHFFLWKHNCNSQTYYFIMVVCAVVHLFEIWCSKVRNRYSCVTWWWLFWIGVDVDSDPEYVGFKIQNQNHQKYEQISEMELKVNVIVGCKNIIIFFFVAQS